MDIINALGISLAVGRLTLDTPQTNELVSKFLQSRRQGLSQKTLTFYEGCLKRAPISIRATPRDIDEFLKSLHCTNGSKHGYFRALRAFYRWLYSAKSGYNLNPHDNPILLVEAPKVEKRILPSLSLEQVNHLIQEVASLRDKAIISLLADSGIRLNELTNIKASDIGWENYTITIWGKGNKQRKAPFTERSASLLRELISQNGTGSNVWQLNYHGIETMLKRLGQDTGIHCNAHSFRRGFACNLHRKGLSTLDIMHLGGWQDLSMVLRYTRSITFDDCLEHYRQATS